MPTFNQILSSPRLHKIRSNRSWLLFCCPQKKAYCHKVTKVSPKKPNSAQRSVARVGFSTCKKINVYIPGEGHNVQRFSAVLVRGGRVPDLPGVNFKVIRGKYDCNCVILRRSSRSLYGTKKWIKSKLH